MNKVAQKQSTHRFIKKLSKKLARSNHCSATNVEYFKVIMNAQLSGNILLPHGLGLNQSGYQELRKDLNDNRLMRKELDWYKEDWTFIRERAANCAELFEMKQDERRDLITLLSCYRNEQDLSSGPMAIILATASLTQFHLWESLGLADRAQLGELIKYNFPKLYALNKDNMRWKRFFYHQLCQQGGDYLCRAPSCQECKSNSECFA